MSIEAMNVAYRSVVGSPTRKAVLITLANMADHNGKCFPSVQYIASRTELTPRTVSRSLSKLAEDGYLEIRSRTSKTGQRSNVYVIDCRGVTETPDPLTQCHPPLTESALPPDTVSPITIINNHITSIYSESEFKDWMRVRKLKKAIWTDRVAKRVLADLLKLSNGDPEIQRLIIAQSADNGWTDIFPLRNKNGNNKQQIQTPLDRHNELVRKLEADETTVVTDAFALRQAVGVIIRPD